MSAYSLNLPTQAGADPDHVTPSARQVLTSLPEVRSSSYPVSQVYVAVLPVNLTSPLIGADNGGH